MSKLAWIVSMALQFIAAILITIWVCKTFLPIVDAVARGI